MNRRSHVIRTQVIRMALLGVSLGMVLFAVTGNFFFVIISGGSAVLGVCIGRFIQHSKK